MAVERNSSDPTRRRAQTWGGNEISHDLPIFPGLSYDEVLKRVHRKAVLARLNCFRKRLMFRIVALGTIIGLV